MARDLVQRYPDLLEFVGRCDQNPKRTQAAAAEIYVTKSFGKRTNVPMPKMTEGHGVGGDDRMPDNSIGQRRPIRIADVVKI